MLIVRWFFRIKTDREVKAYEQTQSESSEAPETINLIVKNPLMTGKTIGELKEIADERIQVSRLLRNNNIIFPADNLKLEMNDTLYVVVSKEYQEKLKVMVGETTDTNIKKIRGPLSMRHVVVTNRKISGKSLREINIYGRYNANITRIFRSGLEFIPSKGTKLEFGDTVRIVGDKHILKSVATELGDSERELQHPNILPIFIGIFLGVIVGSIPIAIPGLPAPVKLGLAGGPLLIAILLGRAGRIGKMDFYIPMGANLILRETGIVLFLACVGLGAGGQFVETIAQGGYIWMIYGAAITFIPIMSIAVVARFLRYNYLTICGLVSGSMTDPPALGFANAIADSQAQSTAYATVYPLVMFLRVLSAQVFVLLTL
jgi:putative transport protein